MMLFDVVGIIGGVDVSLSGKSDCERLRCCTFFIVKVNTGR